MPGDTNGLADAHVYDRLTGVTERVSLGLAGTQALGGDTHTLSLSADGRFVAMASSATNLVLNDTNGVQDVFVRDRLTGTTTRVSVPTSFGQAAGASGYNLISADGRYVVFTSTASNLVAGDTNGHQDVFRRDRATGTTVRVNIAHDGAQANSFSVSPSMSADGQVIAFESSATNLVPGDTNNREDVFVRDLQTGVTVRVSIGPNGVQADERSLEPSISGDGRFVAFTSRASNLIAGGGIGIYLHDRQNGGTSALSTRPHGKFEFDAPREPIISGNGRHVCYGVRPALFLVDRQTLAKTRVDVATNGDAANFQSLSCAASADATILAFVSAANNLVDGDVNGTPDVFVRTNFPTMALDKTALTFAAVTSGTAFVSQTAAQQITSDAEWKRDGNLDRGRGSTMAAGEPRLGRRLRDVVDQRRAGRWLAVERHGDRHDHRLSHGRREYPAADRGQPDAIPNGTSWHPSASSIRRPTTALASPARYRSRAGRSTMSK